MTRRPRLWRWVLVVWAVVVAVGAGLTWWLQDSGEPQQPAGGTEFSPAPSLPEGWESMCPALTEGEGDALCFIRTR